jgi:hypothetical protein
MEPIGCSETSLRNYHCTMRNIPEERSYRLIYLEDSSRIVGQTVKYLLKGLATELNRPQDQSGTAYGSVVVCLYTVDGVNVRGDVTKNEYTAYLVCHRLSGPFRRSHLGLLSDRFRDNYRRCNTSNQIVPPTVVWLNVKCTFSCHAFLYGGRNNDCVVQVFRVQCHE